MRASPKPCAHSTTTHPVRLALFSGFLLALATPSSAQTPGVFALGASTLCEASAFGSDSVTLGVTPATAAWTASANVPWLHVSPASAAGTGSTNVVFSFDANSGPTRSGTLTIAGQTLTVVQASPAYVPAGVLTTLTSGLDYPGGLAVDSAGDVYIALLHGHAVDEWVAASNSVTTVATFTLFGPWGLTMDPAGNVYFPDNLTNSVGEWLPAPGNLATLSSPDLVLPGAVAAGTSGNLYLIDAAGDVKQWNLANNTVTELILAGQLSACAVAVDVAGNLYFVEQYPGVCLEWNATTHALTTLASNLNYPCAVAVDGRGNVYITDTANGAILKWSPVDQSVSTVIGAGAWSQGVTVDSLGNVYFSDDVDGTLRELPRVLVDTTAKLEGLSAGHDSLSPILPAPPSLPSLFMPLSEESWLTIDGVTNGVVSFSFSAATSNRVGYIRLFGQAIPVAQAAGAASVGPGSFLVGPGAGSDGVALLVSPALSGWTATANALWLHANPAGGLGSTNVLFNYDANSGPMRVGTLTIAGQTVTVTQAGAACVAVGVLPLVSNNLNQPYGVAFDAVGNLYIADTGNGAFKVWSPTNPTATRLVASAIGAPAYLAVDGAGDIYFSDFATATVRRWTAADQTVTNITWWLRGVGGVALDAAGDLLYADGGRNTLTQWMTDGSGRTNILSSSLSGPIGVAVGADGRVYIADAGDPTYYAPSALAEWDPAWGNGQVLTLASQLYNTTGLAVDQAGNLYFAQVGNNSICEWNQATKILTYLAQGTVSQPHGVAVDSACNLYIADTGNNRIAELPHAFIDLTGRSESAGAGSDSFAPILATSLNFPLYPASDQPWLTLNSVSKGVVSFSFAATTSNRTAHISLCGQSISVFQRSPFFLGTTNLLEPPNAGADSVVLAVIPSGAAWSASTTAAWLHLPPASQSGTNSADVVFTYDANAGPTRSATITIADQTLTVTQAGAGYAASALPFALTSTGLAGPAGVAALPGGAVCIADSGHNTLLAWSPSNNAVSVLWCSGLANPRGVAADAAGNVYFADSGNNAVKMWSAANNIVTTLVGSGLSGPSAVALDAQGNLYLADTGNNAIEEWVAASNAVVSVVSDGLAGPSGVAVDRAGNVYIADTGNNAVKVWTALSQVVTPLITNGLAGPSGLAVDGGGNVYVADAGNNAIQKWSPATGKLAPLISSGLSAPEAVALDGAGDVFVADTGHGAVEELLYAFVPVGAFEESAEAGADALGPIMPVTTPALPPFDAGSDAMWLTPLGVTNGMLSFSFEANTGAVRTAHLLVLGLPVAVTQSGRSCALGTSLLNEGPSAGADSVTLGLVPRIVPWSASTTNDWLHLSAANQSGAGSANVVFTYDANPGPARSGGLTINGQTVTVNQAPATYLPVTTNTPLVAPPGSVRPNGIAVDGAGNVFFTDSGAYALRRWNLASNNVSTLVSTGLLNPNGAAVDSAGNAYFADTSHNAIKQWLGASNTVVSLVSTGLLYPYGLALDRAGNVFIADTDHNAVKKWSPATGRLTSVVSTGLAVPRAVAVDAAGNVYIADTGHEAIKVWLASSNTVVTLLAAGVSSPTSVAVDGSGNVYYADSGLRAIQKWTAASNTVTAVVSSGLTTPVGVAVDPAGNVYFSDSARAFLAELPRAFADGTAKSEGLLAGVDALAPVFPANANLRPPFRPASDQPWLAIAGVTNGIVTFSFTTNPGLSRSAHVNLLGLPIAVTQLGVTAPELTAFQLQANGSLQFSFTNTPGASFSVLTTTNLSLPSSKWTVIAVLTNLSGGLYQFTSPSPTDTLNRFYRIRSP